MIKTLGISPKVYIPVIVQIIVGVILILTGSDVEGKTLLLTAAGTGALGFGAPNSPTLTVGTADPIDPDETRNITSIK
jgi:hypothetical protein